MDATAAPSRKGWLVVGALLLMQFALFRQTVEREITPQVPLGNDQTSYLSMAYESYQAGLDGGAWAGLSHAAGIPAPSGCLLHLQAAFTFLFLGASRASALLPNFLYYAALQGVVVAVVLSRTRRWGAAYFALGLLLCAGTAREWLGGLYDFRIDSIAFSLYGVLVGVCVLSDGFASRRWSLAVGAVAGLLFLFRYLTLVYLGGAMALWAAFVLASATWTPREERHAVWGRLRNAGLACLVYLAVVVPVVAARYEALWNYYGVGHLAGGEKDVRARENEIYTRADSLLYYARSVWELHAGRAFFAVAAVGLVASLAFWRRRTAAAVSAPGWALAALALLVPWLVLTANTAKSPLVASALVGALLWVCLLPLIRSAGAWPAWAIRSVAAVGLVAGVTVVLCSHCRREPRLGRSDADRRQIVALHDDLARHALSQGWATAVISSDTVVDYLPPNTLGVPAFERQGLSLHVDRGLGAKIFAVSDEEAHSTVEQSHFVLLRDGESLTNAALPAREDLARRGPWMREYCRTRMQPVGTYPMLGGAFTLYARPSLRPSATEKDWVTSAGLRLTGEAASLREFPHVRLLGQATRAQLPRHPEVEVTLGGGRKFPAKVTFPSDDRYVVEFEVPADAPLPPKGEVTLSLKFDAHFVPRDLGINSDTRELVVFGPKQVELTARRPAVAAAGR